MCGIAGYVGQPIASGELVFSLWLLRQRGQEGYGLAALTEDGRFEIHRSLQLLSLPIDLSVEAAIAHNRLPTHGEVAVHNCHPFVARCAGKEIAVAHNGIVANHVSLRQRLEAEGHRFSSEVDSEVLVHLAEPYADDPDGLVRAVNARAYGTITAAFLLPALRSVVLLRNQHGPKVWCVEAENGVAFASARQALPVQGKVYSLDSLSAQLFSLRVAPSPED